MLLRNVKRCGRRANRDKLEGAAPDKAKPEIKLDGAGVYLPDVKKWDFSAAKDLGRQDTDQFGRVAMACMVRVCAHGANFSEAGKAQAFACHGDQLPFLTNAQVRSKLMRSDAKGTRPR
jgi:hypothetical protein